MCTLLIHLYLVQIDSATPVLTQPPPAWVSWDYPCKHLSPAFHEDTQEFEALISWLKTKPYCSPLHDPYGREMVLLVCLGIGLVFRDLQTIQFTEEGEDFPDELGDFLKDTSLTWAHVDALADACHSLEMVLKSCLQSLETDDDLEEPTAIQPASAPISGHTPENNPPAKKGKRCAVKKQASSRTNRVVPE
jgi:hypothetical protein